MAPVSLIRGSLIYEVKDIVRPGETISSTRLTIHPGGKGANQAYALAKAGAQAALEANTGPDGTWVTDLLRTAGVEVGKVTLVQDQVTGRAIIQKSADGENAIVLHKGANFSRSSASQPQLNGCTHLLVQNKIPFDITVSYVMAAAKQGVVTIFNPSPMPDRDELRNLPWSALTWLLVNEGELQGLCTALDLPLSGSVAEQRASDRAIQKLQLLSSSKHFALSTSIICTLGSAGLVYYRASEGDQTIAETGHLPAVKLVNPLVDTTGAGDCFAGYFVAGLMRDEDLGTILKTCLTACAICVENSGAIMSYPTLADVIRRRRECES